ncbi:MAG: hypothetical protein H0Z39_05195 [Peptococcaceae bacterium]|nr:hypothetical protein [Peptococcaceae bacterium]
MEVLLLMVVFAIIIGFEVPRLLQNEMYRELIGFALLMFIGMIWSFGLLLDLPLPNFIQSIDAMINPLFDAMVQVLHLKD